MKKIHYAKIGAVGILFLLLVGMAFVPLSGAVNQNRIQGILATKGLSQNGNPLDTSLPADESGPMKLDTYYVPYEDVSFAGEQNDIGYNTDAKNGIVGSYTIYVGEPVVETIPGCGRTGMLDPSSGDPSDWYRFSACEGQSMQVSVSTSQDYGAELADSKGQVVGSSYTADVTGWYFIDIFANEGAEAGEYTIQISLSGQNDAGTGSDAGDTMGSATTISPGSYEGYMDSTDVEDWYKFTVTDGEGIFATVTPLDKTDYDLHLFNPAGELVHSAQFYGEDTLEYPTDVSGIWTLKIDMFPGWDTSLWPDNYFLYGSGPYELDLNIGGTAESPPGPIPQPAIIPVAQTFIIEDDASSTKDEYGYLAAIPAANYIEDGNRYVSPIVYQGIDTITNWYGTVDDTTQYLIDDWETYLARHGLQPEEQIVLSDPVKAAAEIATTQWDSSDTVVLAVDGSGFEDTVTTVVENDETISSSPDVTTLQPSELKKVGAYLTKPMFLGKKWGAIHLIAYGDTFSGDTGVITPKYEALMEDWWPSPYDEPGMDKDTFFPITKTGLWLPYVTVDTGLEELQIIRYPGNRYTIPISSTESSIKVTISTEEPSNLVVYLIDPENNIRRPQVPHWNGGEINQIHYWNGGHWEHNFDEFRTWTIDAHDDYSVEVHNAMKGTWTAIVVPYLNGNFEDTGFNGGYHITAEVRTYSPDRINAALSAANAAVIASANHAPLLYVTKDTVPTETSQAISQLGASKVVFVNINGVSSAAPSGTVTEYGTMQEVVDAIKAESMTENFITITSLGTGDGYFAPSAMIAAYHTAPVLNIGEAVDAYNMLDMAAAWQEYAGDFYHGCRSVGHLPVMDHPFDLKEVIMGFLQGNAPAPGFDLDLKWMRGAYNDIYRMTSDYGLDEAGQEAYMFVSPRDGDIRDLVGRAMTGNNSYAGHIPVEPPAFASAIICRDILYPAIIFSNEGRDVVSSCFMNYRDGHDWRANNGERTQDFVTQKVKQFGFSHGRTYEGHSIWSNLLERYNEGAALVYHCSHGTGGSGICCLYENIEEQFPLAEPRYEHLKDFNWWDGWRGYYYDNAKTSTPREGGLVWVNPEEPNLYDIVHFKYCDQLFDNLHSEFNFWMSCTTGSHFGPNVYLEHGAALWFGNGGTGLSPQEEILDSWMFEDLMYHGKSVGESISKYYWLHQRDYTTGDPVTIYGSSSLQLTNVQMIFGDPTMTCFSPEWIEPVPVTA